MASFGIVVCGRFVIVFRLLLFVVALAIGVAIILGLFCFDVKSIKLAINVFCVTVFLRLFLVRFCFSLVCALVFLLVSFFVSIS